MVEVNSLGKFQRSLGIKPSRQGKDIELTIDIFLQLAAEEALSDKKAGAIIVMDPRNGAIKAMASKPTFDLNFFQKILNLRRNIISYLILLKNLFLIEH